MDQRNKEHRVLVHNNVDMVEDHYSIIPVDTFQMMQAFVMRLEEPLVVAVVENDVNSMLRE